MFGKPGTYVQMEPTTIGAGSHLFGRGVRQIVEDLKGDGKLTEKRLPKGHFGRQRALGVEKLGDDGGNGVPVGDAHMAALWRDPGDDHVGIYGKGLNSRAVYLRRSA